MGLFGWDLPPGVTMRDIDPPELPCEICGEFVDNCICPECSVCGGVGDPLCYEKHGLVRSKQQIENLTKREAEWAAEAREEEKYWDARFREWKEGEKKGDAE